MCGPVLSSLPELCLATADCGQAGRAGQEQDWLLAGCWSLPWAPSWAPLQVTRTPHQIPAADRCRTLANKCTLIGRSPSKYQVEAFSIVDELDDNVCEGGGEAVH